MLAPLVPLLLLTSRSSMSLPAANISVYQAPVRSNSEDVGLGGDWTAIKADLPKTQADADALEWPELWRLVEGVLRETGYKGGKGAEAVVGPNGAVGYFGWPKSYEKYLVYTWDFQLGNCKIGFEKRVGKCIDGLWRYVDEHTELSFDPRDVTDITVNYTGRSDTSTVYRADDFDSIEINADEKTLVQKVEDGTNYIFQDPDWLINPEGKAEWQVDSGHYRFVPSEDRRTTVEIPLMGTDKASLHGFAFLLARILNGNGGNDIKVLN